MIFEGMCGHPAVSLAFSSRSFVHSMLRVEASLASAQARMGVIPASAANAIANACEHGIELGQINPQEVALQGAAHASVVVPLIPALKQAVRLRDDSAAKFVHLGATSQDILDTALALALTPLVMQFRDDLQTCVDRLTALARTHASTPCLARTLLQPASTTSFGWKCVQWLEPLRTCAARLPSVASEALQVQLAGASGTGLTLEPHRDAIVNHMADTLGLSAGPPWQTQRQGLLRLASELGIAASALAKCAQDLLLLGQFELQEVIETPPPGGGASSAMPHKRNPVGVVLVLANQQRMPGALSTLFSCAPGELERSAGRWQAELATWPTLVGSALGAGSALAAALSRGLSVQPEMMLRNLHAVAATVDPDSASHWFSETLAQALGARVLDALAG